MTDPDLNPQSQTTMAKLLPWIVLLLSALGLFYFVEKGCGGAPTTKDPVENHADTLRSNNANLDTLQLDSIDRDSIH